MEEFKQAWLVVEGDRKRLFNNLRKKFGLGISIENLPGKRHLIRPLCQSCEERLLSYIPQLIKKHPVQKVWIHTPEDDESTALSSLTKALHGRVFIDKIWDYCRESLIYTNRPEELATLEAYIAKT